MDCAEALSMSGVPNSAHQHMVTQRAIPLKGIIHVVSKSLGEEMKL